MNQRKNWIVIADGRSASLFACASTPGGELHLDHVRSLDNGHERQQDRHRPALLGGAERRGTSGRSGGHAAPHSVAPHHAAEEDQLRYAREVADWLGQAGLDVGLVGGAEKGGRLSVFAPPKLLGLIRDRATSLAGAAEFHEAELSHLSVAELAAHPAVKNAVAGHQTA